MANVLQTQLAEYGYNLVALPKAEIWPLMLLYKVSDSVVSSTNDSVINFFRPTDAAPPVVNTSTNPLPEIQAAANLEFDADAGVGMLNRLLEKLGMGKASAKLKLNAGNTLEIGYENIIDEDITLLQLDNYITGATPQEGKFRTFEAKLKASELYVITEVLKSNQFSIAVKGKNGQSMNVETDVKGIVNANVNVARKMDNALSLSYSGAVPLVFAFKAQQIIYDKLSWWKAFSSEKAGFHIRDQRGIVFKGMDDFPSIPLRSGTSLLEI